MKKPDSFAGRPAWVRFCERGSALGGFLARWSFLGRFLGGGFFRGGLLGGGFFGCGLLGGGCGGILSGLGLRRGLLHLRLGQQAVELGLLLFALQIIRPAAAFDDFV